MIIEIFQILLVTAILGTALVLFAGVKGRVGGVTIGSRAGLVMGMACLMLWGLIAINAFEITVISNGETLTRSYPQVAWIAVAGGAVSLITMLQAAIEEINATGGL